MNVKILPTIDFEKQPQILTIFLLFVFPSFTFSNSFALTCPSYVPITLDICDSHYEMDWADIDWSSDTPIFSTQFDPEQGAILNPGVHDATITVVDINNQQSSCSFTIEVFDMVHSLICQDTVTVSLSNNCTPHFTYETLAIGTPQLCEDQIEIKVIDQFGVTVLSGTSVFLDVSMLNKPYTYTITDFGTPANFSCGGVLNIVGPTLFVLNCPPNEVIFCNDDFNSAMIGEPDPVSCFNDSQINFNFFDQTNTFICPDDKTWQIVRTWVGTNPLGETTQCSHTITGRRFSLSQVLFPPDYDDVQEPAILCEEGLDPSATANTDLTGFPTVGGLPIEPESCDIHVSYTDSLFQICGASYEIRRYWEIVDSCDFDIRTHKQTIIIRDYSEPVFEVIDTIYANISPGCSKFLPMPPITLLEECSDYEVRISTPFDTIYADGGPSEIMFLPGEYFCDYTVTDQCGNSATQPFILDIDIGPLLKCPDDRSISTNFYADNVQAAFVAGDTSALNFFGNAISYSNCPIPFNQTAMVTLDSCGNGEIIRTFTSTDPNINVECEQNIEINHISDFVVEFPADITLECSDNQPFNAGEPIVHFGDWEEMNVSFSDQKIEIVPGYCFRTIRTWTVRNDCVYDIDEGNFVQEVSEDELGMSYMDCNLGGPDTCDIYTFKDGLTVDNFPNSTPDGIIEWIQVIRVNDDINPNIICPDTVQVCIDDNVCNTDIQLTEPEFEDCTTIEEMDFVTDIPGFNENSFAAFDVPPGNYSIEFTAFDECGNGGVCETLVLVQDCVSPTLFCGQGHVVEIEQTGFVEVLASDISEGVSDNCPGDLHFSFSSNLSDTVRVLDCDHLGYTTFEYWVTDENGNQDSCTTFIILEDNTGVICEIEDDECGGNITTVNGEGVGQGTVEISNNGGFFNTFSTNLDGEYLGIYPPSSSTTVTPIKDINPLNGVTTFDLVVLQKHIVFIDRFDDPYQWIAADANNSGTVTISDAVVIKKVILFIDETFPNNTSWRFVDANYDFPNPDNPWEESFPESITNPTAFSYDNDFIAIKIGDLNRNANPSEIINTDDRSLEEAFAFTVPNRKFSSDENIVVPFQVSDFDFAGYQFTLEFDTDILDFQDLIAGFSNQSDFGTKFLKEGILTVSWNGEISHEEETAFALVFKTKKKGTIEQSIQINSRKTRAEAYSNELKLREVKLNFEKLERDENSFLLFQNRPNPFSNQTLINFYLPEAGKVDFEIFNAAGQSIYSLEKSFDKGFNKMEILNDELKNSGVYFYQMKVNSQIETRRMIKLSKD